MKWFRLLRSGVALSILFAAVFFSAALSRAETAPPASIRVAYCRDNAPFYFTGRNGQPDGMIIDQWKLWSEKTKISVEFIPANWAETLELVRTGRADAHAGLFFSKIRDRFLDFGPPLLKTDTHIFYKKTLPLPANANAFKAYRIGVIRGDFVESWFMTHMPELTLAPFTSYEEVMTALKAGELMVFAADTLTGLHHLARHNLGQRFIFSSNTPVCSNHFYPAVKQGNSRLLAAITRGMKKIPATAHRRIAREWATGIRQKDTGDLIIAIDRDNPPLTMVDPDGNPAGLLVDIWRLWSEATGLKIRFRPSSRTESIDAIRTGRADIHSGLLKNKEHKGMVFSDPIYRARTALYFNTGDAVVSLDELSGHPVAVLEGSYQDRWLKANYPKIPVAACPDVEKLILNLLKKEAGAVFHDTMAVEAVLNRLNLAGKIKKSPEAILNTAICAGVPGFNDSIMPLINEGFSGIPRQELSDLESQWIPRRENRFYAGDASVVTLTHDEKEFIANHLPLTFSEVDWKPMSITDDPDNFQGMIADYLAVVTRKTGLGFSFTPSASWSQVLEKYKSGDIDAIPALGDREDAGRPIALSRPFATFPLVIVTRDDVHFIKTASHLNKRQVAVGRDYTSYHYLKNNFPDINLVQTDDVKAGLTALSNRRVDAFVGHMAVVSHTIREAGFTNLKIAGETGYFFNHCIGVDPAFPLALSIINKALDSMTKEDHRAIAQKWISVNYEKGVDLQLIVKILAGALVFITIVVYWNRRLAGEVAERKRTEQRLLESEGKTRAMSEAIHDGLVMIDDKARVMYWNHAAEDLFGIPADRAIGKDILSLLIPEELRSSARQGLKRFAQTGKGPVLGSLKELVAQKKDGTRFPVEVGVSGFQMGENWYAVGTIRDITERNETQRIVQDIRKELQQIFDNTHVGILLLKQHHHLYRCNTRMAEILGYDSPKEVVGMSMADIHLDQDAFEAFGEKYDAPLARGEQVRTECRLKRKDGKGIWCSLSARALDPAAPPDMDQGIIWVIDDISEKRAARQALKESEKRVSTILNSINTGVLIIDPVSRSIVDVNPAASRMIGLPEAEILNQKCHEFICPRMEKECPVIDNHEKIDNQELTLITGDKSRVPILKTVIPIKLNGKQQLLESFVDLTGQKEAEKELQENLKELERFYQMAIGREETMIGLKAEINHLLLQAGEKEKYIIR